jgi:hypothetical protein
MKKHFIITLLLALTAFSCRKAIEPLDFKSNAVDPASGVKLNMIEIDSIKFVQGFFSPYTYVYFHTNNDQIPKTLGAPDVIEVYFDKVYSFSKVFSYSSNKYSFAFIEGASDFEYGFIIKSGEDRKTDMIIPTKP